MAPLPPFSPRARSPQSFRPSPRYLFAGGLVSVVREGAAQEAARLLRLAQRPDDSRVCRRPEERTDPFTPMSAALLAAAACEAACEAAAAGPPILFLPTAAAAASAWGAAPFLWPPSDGGGGVVVQGRGLKHISLIGYRADATNASVWKRRWFHSLEGVGFYCTIDVADSEEHILKAVGAAEELKRWADVEVVYDSTGDGALVLISAQLQNVGLPLWTDKTADYETRVYHCCTDAGPDPKQKTSAHPRTSRCESFANLVLRSELLRSPGPPLGWQRPRQR